MVSRIFAMSVRQWKEASRSHMLSTQSSVFFPAAPHVNLSYGNAEEVGKMLWFENADYRFLKSI